MASAALEEEELVTRIRRQREESEKFVAEQKRLMAEALKMDAENTKLAYESIKLNNEATKLLYEGLKLQRDRHLMWFTAIAASVAAVATAINLGYSALKAMKAVP